MKGKYSFSLHSYNVIGQWCTYLFHNWWNVNVDIHVSHFVTLDEESFMADFKVEAILSFFSNNGNPFMQGGPQMIFFLGFTLKPKIILSKEKICKIPSPFLFSLLSLGGASNHLYTHQMTIVKSTSGLTHPNRPRY